MYFLLNMWAIPLLCYCSLPGGRWCWDFEWCLIRSQKCQGYYKCCPAALRLILGIRGVEEQQRPPWIFWIKRVVWSWCWFAKGNRQQIRGDYLEDNINNHWFHLDFDQTILAGSWCSTTWDWDSCPVSIKLWMIQNWRHLQSQWIGF